MLPENLDELYLNAQMYKPYEFSNDEITRLFDHLNEEHKLDCFCLGCGKESTFLSRESDNYNTSNRVQQLKELQIPPAYPAFFKCVRNDDHTLVFIFDITKFIITKIGQYPSSADISNVEIKKYHTLLGNDKYRELNKAVGLASHGIGIGSFVYLRRIFEDLIEEAHVKARTEPVWNEDAYSKLRMVDRIGVLELYLPPFLVSNRGMYSILSKGIHELSEDECLEMFPVMKLSIELILDEKLQERDKQNKIASATKGIMALLHKIKT
jgi:hypothetical protein